MDYEVVVIGAGVAGIYQIKRLVDLGVRATVVDANAGLGGTWFKNRYPGCRFDSESISYGYSFSQEVLDEWSWSEQFASQPETLRYLEYVADKFDLRSHMQFDSRVERMTFDEQSNVWELFVEGGRRITTRFVITAIGILSAPTLPRLAGMDRFRGESFHSMDWPEFLDLSGKRVGVVGTGATAIQIIPEVARAAEELFVFQRRPNWAAPLNNGPISEAEMDSVRARYPEIFARCARSAGGFLHEPDKRSFYDVSRDERIDLWDRLYEEPGFGIWLQNFTEIFTDERANAEFSDYIARRIRERVSDPDIAERLIPKDHGFGEQRVPLETGYYETFNRHDVHLVDLTAEPIEEIEPHALRTTRTTYPLDVLVYATGFDAFTGAFDRTEIRGRDGRLLKDKWARGPETYLGILVHGFPNLFMLAGPQLSATNFPRGAETSVDWVTSLLEHCSSAGHERVEASSEGEQEWCAEVASLYETVLLGRARSGITGYNSNLDGHEYGKTRYNLYMGGGPRYTARLDSVQGRGYDGIEFA